MANMTVFVANMIVLMTLSAHHRPLVRDWVAAATGEAGISEAFLSSNTSEAFPAQIGYILIQF